MTPSENRPHRVTRKGSALGPIFDTYQDAFAYWRTHHDTLRDPWVIVTVATGRVIAPETPIVDVNE